jgi:dolichol-phosphate mannosyltransferase
MVVIATYNERHNIEPLLARIRGAAPTEPVLFVDDSSPDGTADAVRSFQKSDPVLHLIVRQGQRGYGAACREALQRILDERLAPYVIQMDADLSHPPEALPTMIQMLETCPVVVGSRYVPGGGTENWDWRRRWLSRGGNLYARMLTGVPVRDATAGFVGYQIETLRKIDLGGICSEGYAFLMEMKFSLHRSGVRICEFPITFTERELGKSKFNSRIMREGMLYPWKALWQRVF